jgi:iron(III) transport system substrate-binding protein
MEKVSIPEGARMKHDRVMGVVAGAILAVLCGTSAGASTPAIDAQTIALAQKDGSLTFYGSMYAPQLQEVANRFQQQYGIHVDVLRMESNALPARVAIEAKSGTPHADVLQDPGFQIDVLKREGLLAKFPLPEDADMTKGTYDPDGYWSAFCVNTETISYNPKLLAAAGLKPPQSWFDFVKPEWNGKFALFSGSYEWFAAMEKSFGKDRADQYLRAMAANGVHMVSSHQVAETMLESGEYTAGVNTYGYSMSHDQAQGLAVVEVNPDPTVIELLGVAITANAPHPNAAKLFMRWLVTRDTQQWITDHLGRISARRDVTNNPAIWGPKIHFVISDPADSVHYQEYVHDFNAIFGVQ